MIFSIVHGYENFYWIVDKIMSAKVDYVGTYPALLLINCVTFSKFQNLPLSSSPNKDNNYNYFLGCFGGLMS